MKKRLFVPLILACLLPLVAGAASTPSLTAFSATYKVLRKGSPLGTSTLDLQKNDDGTWTYSSSLEAESGLAAMLGGSIKESSRFRLEDGHVQALSYDYQLHSSFKSRERHMDVDWKTDTVTVDGSKGSHHFKTKPGLVERHLLVLALARAVTNGQTDIALPVAGEKRIKKQTYTVSGHESLDVPLGQIDTVRVERTHDDKGYQVWFAPERFGNAPVKLSQESGGDITLLLKSYKQL